MQYFRFQTFLSKDDHNVISSIILGLYITKYKILIHVEIKYDFTTNPYRHSYQYSCSDEIHM